MEGSPLRIGPIGIDASEGRSKNGAMAKEQLRQFAETLRTGRAKLDLNKTEFWVVGSFAYAPRIIQSIAVRYWLYAKAG